MSPQFIDIGANLTHDSFAADLDAVIERALAAGVRRQVVTGADLSHSRAAADLARARPDVLFSTAGVHPHHAANFVLTQLDDLRELLERPEVVAVGECGLDYHRNFSPPDAQRRAFEAQLRLAAEIGKPVFLHQREAHADFRDMLKTHRGSLRAGVAHCFTGQMAELEDYLELDLFIGMTGWVCDERRGVHLRQVIPAIPADRLMIETDAPYILPRDLEPKPKSRRNEPACLPHIATVIAALRGVGLETLAQSTSDNATGFFRLPPAAPRSAA